MLDILVAPSHTWTMGTVSVVSDPIQTPPSSHHDSALVSGIVTPTLVESTLRRNDSTKPWIVAKFGGTSVGKVPEVIAEDIVKQWLDKNRVVAVCSARSSETKSAGTTNRWVIKAGGQESR